MSRELEMARALVKILEEKENAEVVSGVPVAPGCPLSTLNPGDVFKIEGHDFIVLEQMDSTTAVISKGLMVEDEKFSDDTKDYNKSAIKHLIETTIQPEIEAVVGVENLVEHIVDLTSVDMQNEFGSCTCKVRPITFDEARRYNDLLVNNDLPDWYWTCTPWSTKERGWEHSVAVVSPRGYVSNYNCGGHYGVRPFCILKSNIFVSKVEE